MLRHRLPIRFWITAGFLIGAWVLLNATSRGETIGPRRPLRDLSYQLGMWEGKDQPLQDQVVEAAAVTEYANRIYSEPARLPLQLYIGYYASQKTGETIHSPKNCLPGAGWDPIHSGYARLTVEGGQQIVVNQYVIQRDQDRLMVFYWYQSHGRVVASEYAGKFWMIADAIYRDRTDGSLVRIATPMNDGESAAYARLASFTTLLFPALDQIIPK